jgi:hypothetical protein
MELNILKIDLDKKSFFLTIKILKQRLSYLHDLKIFSCNLIEEIVLIKKTKYSAKIYLKENLADEKNIIILQLLLGSDYMKEANTLLNHFVYKMSYSNRMFDVKRYKNGDVICGVKYNVTNKIKQYILDKNRKKNYN